MNEDPRAEMMRSRQEFIDGKETDRQKSMERRVMSQLMTAYGVKRKKWIIREIQEKGHTLTWLWDQHPDVPIKLIARHIYRWSLLEIFTRPTKSPVYEAFEDAFDTYPDDWVGAVFHADKLGEMIIHNWPRKFPGTCIVPPCSANYGPLIIQQFKHFIPRLRDEWDPVGYPLEV